MDSRRYKFENEMKEFLIYAKVTVSVYTKVEAETIEQAIELANDRTPMAIIPNGGDTEGENWMLDEIDGEPFDLHEE
jgi:hypothetical protein